MMPAINARFLLIGQDRLRLPRCYEAVPHRVGGGVSCETFLPVVGARGRRPLLLGAAEAENVEHTALRLGVIRPRISCNAEREAVMRRIPLPAEHATMISKTRTHKKFALRWPL